MARDPRITDYPLTTDGIYMTPKDLVDVYAAELLPPGFRYPQRFLDMVGKTDTRWYYPWYFFPPTCQAGVARLEFLPSHFNRPLVPFASLELGDGDVACFDGSDTGGNPAIVMAILDGSDRFYAFKDFDDWERQAWEEAQKWNRDWLDD